MIDRDAAICLSLSPSEDPVALLRAARGSSIVLVIDDRIDAIERAMAKAAVIAIATARAPDTRISAIITAADIDPAATDAAVDFFHRSPAVTAQVIDLL